MASGEPDDLISIYNEPFVHRGVVWTNLTSSPEILKRCENFQFRPEDVVVVSLPRNGTTLTQEIVWQVLHQDVVRKDARYGSLSDRFPFLEHKEDPYPIDRLEKQSGPRLMKTHLPFCYIKSEVEKASPKMIVVIRNPKDVVASGYPLFRGFKELKEDVPFSRFWRAFMSNRMINGNFGDFYLGYWGLRDRENVLILRYEDLVRQPHQEVRRVAAFLDRRLTAEKVATIVHNTSFDVMVKNEEVNLQMAGGGHFIRKGKVGDWKNMLTVSQSEEMDAWIRDELGPANLTFQFE